MEGITEAALLEALHAALRSEPVGATGLSMRDIREHFKLGDAKARRLVRKLQLDGVAEVVWGTQIGIHGNPVRVTFYRLTPTGQLPGTAAG